MENPRPKGYEKTGKAVWKTPVIFHRAKTCQDIPINHGINRLTNGFVPWFPSEIWGDGGVPDSHLGMASMFVAGADFYHLPTSVVGSSTCAVNHILWVHTPNSFDLFWCISISQNSEASPRNTPRGSALRQPFERIWRFLPFLPSGNLTVCYWKWWFMVDFPMKNGGSFHSYVNVYQRVPAMHLYNKGLVPSFPRKQKKWTTFLTGHGAPSLVRGVWDRGEAH